MDPIGGILSDGLPNGTRNEAVTRVGEHDLGWVAKDVHDVFATLLHLIEYRLQFRYL